MPPEIKIQEEQQQYILSTRVSYPRQNLDLHYLGKSSLFAREVLCFIEMCRQRRGVSFVWMKTGD